VVRLGAGGIERNRALFPAVSMRAGLKPLIQYDEVRQKVEEEGKRKYARRKEREKARPRRVGASHAIGQSAINETPMGLYAQRMTSRLSTRG